jgi:N-acetylglutamate synthase-like GNAT family acetyltransferase
MLEPRAPLDTEVPQLMLFLNQHLRPGTNWSIENEYPHVFTQQNRGNLRVILDGDKIIAHAAVKYLLVKNTFGIFKVAAIGSVLTHPDYRNQGLSQKIIESCLAGAQKEGADFAILWTDLYDLYRKMGFELAGTEVSMLIDVVPPTYNANLKFLKSDKVSADAILRLYSQHTCGTLRTAEEIRKNLAVPNTRIYTAWDASNQLLAYAIEGKGADLKGYIHEWGGAVSALLPLLTHVRRDIGSPITVIAPAHAQNLIRQLQDWGVVTNEGFLGMIRPVNFENLFFKLRRYARQMGVYDFIIEQRGEQFVIGLKNDLATIESVGALTRLLFGPFDETQLKPEFQKILPIPMWIWGWDSV